ncbi:hypothetical protein MNEG_9610 [Monoraphidium neglectum]|uniref:Uncharacterized protein n=1 Tax=Monoraphidium neglectum TaxID=145388 RepID=A0A0D2JFV8_9CHLO|nr:hypothetical protein MNEG_9610 [Monoraphidium neglectum]KIY98352.1 hypothetical protein MNEG_9610 [Monoraphidium neglectum]|eukprot:XP_013897372.1 hypothetical protein MNEG_9610 [Monoraphidium neglectum]
MNPHQQHHLHPSRSQVPRPAYIPPRLLPQPPDPESVAPPPPPPQQDAPPAAPAAAAADIHIEATPVVVLSFPDEPAVGGSGAGDMGMPQERQPPEASSEVLVAGIVAHASVEASNAVDEGIAEDEVGAGREGDEDEGEGASPLQLVPSVVLAASSRPASAATKAAAAAKAAAPGRATDASGGSRAASARRPLAHLSARELEEQWAAATHRSDDVTTAAPAAPATAGMPAARAPAVAAVGGAAGPAAEPMVWLSFAAPFAEPPPLALPPRPEAGPEPEYQQPALEPGPAPFVAPAEQVGRLGVRGLGLFAA